MFTELKNQRGFVLAEFIIALPLFVLLIYALAQIIMQISTFSQKQATDYVLENEAHEILEQIKRDARAATYAEVSRAVGNKEIYEIFFYYSALSDSPARTTNLKVPHRYTVGATDTHGHQIYAERLKNGPKVNPISGGNFLADTVVTELTFSTHRSDVYEDKIGKLLHITLELQVAEKNIHRKFKISTSVFMPACEKILGAKILEDE